jgi:hypothetical protein
MPESFNSNLPKSTIAILNLLQAGFIILYLSASDEFVPLYLLMDGATIQTPLSSEFVEGLIKDHHIEVLSSKYGIIKYTIASNSQRPDARSLG